MAQLSPEELHVLKLQRQAMLAGDREAWLPTVAPELVSEMLTDWPGPSRVESADAAWAVYRDFFAQFERATYEYLNVDRRNNFTVIDIRCELVGVGSGTPVEVVWTVVSEFDSEACRYTTHRWFHARDEAIAWISGLPERADRDPV